MEIIDLREELGKVCNSCMEAQSRCVELEQDNKIRISERDKLVHICDTLLREREDANRAA